VARHEIGDLDLLGEVLGVGLYDDCLRDAEKIKFFAHTFSVLSLKKLIDSKRAAGRGKDLMALPELEALLEYERKAGSHDREPNAW
jgi:hypothetical protein